MGALDRISVAAIGTSVADLEAETLRAEAAGVECVWAPELFRSAATQAAYLAAKTTKIDVATGILWASPAVPSSTRSAPSTSTRCPAAASGSGWAPGSNG
jgi:hypothetical protein